MKVGIRLGSLGTGSLKKDLQRTLAIGVHGVQLRVVDTEIDPRALSGSGREELADYIESLGFDVPALSGELGGFGDSATVDERMSRTQAMLDMCVDLRVAQLTVDAGTFGEAGSRNHELIAGALGHLASHALERGVRIAVTTANTNLEQLAAFLKYVKSDGARINYDPAELSRYGHDPVAGLRAIAPLVSHVQARDAQRGAPLNPGEECALSEGDAHIEEGIATLRECGYDAYLTVAWDRDADLAHNVVESVSWLMRQDGVDP